MSDANATHRWIKENVEAVAIAIVMALVIRQFAVEAFKIPTESMAPTLLGDTLGGGTGDRILVDKIPIMFGEPSRWSVMVFKYPLNEAKNYIKRLVGLPGETLSIRDGDVIIDGKIARKPDPVQEVLFFSVYPGVLTEEELERAWQTDDGDPWRKPDGAFEVDSRAPAFMSYFRKVRDALVWAEGTGGVHPVGDVRLRLTVTPEGGKGDVVVLRITDLRVENDLVLAVGEGESFLRHGEEKIPLTGVVLEPGEETEVSFANVDDALVAVVDGDEFRHEFEPVATDDFDHSGDAVRFGVEHGKARFTDVHLDRDVYYTTQGVTHEDVLIPEDGYFMLGDNSLKSADSREWKRIVYVLHDGREYARDDRRDEDPAERPDAPPGNEVFQDIHGIWRIIPRGDIARQRTEPAPFVPRENLIGRAFFVFWPMPPVSNQFRLKFIR